MRIIRVQYKESVFYAELLEGAVRCLHRQLNLPDPLPMSEISILPLVAPSKVVCVGLNYRAHAQELNFPIPKRPEFFLKPPTSILPHGHAIVLPEHVGRIDAEAELALVIGQTCRNVTPDHAPHYVFGYTCANDVTARDVQREDSLIGHCKSYDTFCPVGPWLETEVADVNNLSVRCVVNDMVRQQSNTADMIFSPMFLVSYLSKIMTLIPGDLILTGTPKGVSAIHDGDMVQVEIDGVGVLFNRVEAQAPQDVVMQ